MCWGGNGQSVRVRPQRKEHLKQLHVLVPQQLPPTAGLLLAAVLVLAGGKLL